jgi:hypothetical protein
MLVAGDTVVRFGGVFIGDWLQPLINSLGAIGWVRVFSAGGTEADRLQFSGAGSDYLVDPKERCVVCGEGLNDRSFAFCSGMTKKNLVILFFC